MKKCECGEGIPEGSKVFHHPEVGYLGPCCASEQDAESVLLAGEDTDEDDTDEDDTDEDDTDEDDTDEDDTDEDDDSDDDEDDTDEDDEDEEEPGTPPGTVRVWIDGEDFDEDEIMRTLVVTLRPDDADEDEDEDADEDEDEDADEDEDEDADEDADEDEDEDEDADEDADEDDYYLSRYELVSYLRSHCGDPRWEQDPSEPDVVRVRVPLGLRKTLQDKLLALDCVEDCAEA